MRILKRKRVKKVKKAMKRKTKTTQITTQAKTQRQEAKVSSLQNVNSSDLHNFYTYCGRQAYLSDHVSIHTEVVKLGTSVSLLTGCKPTYGVGFVLKYSITFFLFQQADPDV